VTETQHTPRDSAAPAGERIAPPARRGRGVIVATMLVSLVGSGLASHLARETKAKQTNGGGGQSGESLNRLDSYALALLLGGLRGPLVMALWTSSEAQKGDRQLKDFDTKVELIRLLQPEFDSVHIYQIWNKAYNISVQVASLANKYITVIDAIRYAEQIDAERPDNINLLNELGRIYFDKLGNSSEKDYYRKRVREDSKFRNQTTQPSAQSITYRANRLDSVLDADGNVLPELLAEKANRKGRIVPNADSLFEKLAGQYSGAKLQGLENLGPFPYGLSTFGYSLAYYKRAQLLLAEGQRHTQLSELVIDSRPALTLKNWAEEEFERSRRIEASLFGRTLPEERINFEGASADLPLTTVPNDAAKVEELLFSLRQTWRLNDAAAVEYNEHLTRFPQNANTFQQHLDGIRAISYLVKGDEAYLSALVRPAGERASLLAKARENYVLAAGENARIILRYYVEEEAVRTQLPQIVSRAEVGKISDEQAIGAYTRIATGLNASTILEDQYAEERAEYVNYFDRAAQRIALIDAAK